jgi:hypothetical protein
MRAYAAQHFGSCPPGGTGRKRHLGDVASFLRFAVDRAGAEPRWRPLQGEQGGRRYRGGHRKSAVQRRRRPHRNRWPLAEPGPEHHYPEAVMARRRRTSGAYLSGSILDSAGPGTILEPLPKKRPGSMGPMISSCPPPQANLLRQNS